MASKKRFSPQNQHTQWAAKPRPQCHPVTCRLSAPTNKPRRQKPGLSLRYQPRRLMLTRCAKSIHAMSMRQVDQCLMCHFNMLTACGKMQVKTNCTNQALSESISLVLYRNQCLWQAAHLFKDPRPANPPHPPLSHTPPRDLVLHIQKLQLRSSKQIRNQLQTLKAPALTSPLQVSRSVRVYLPPWAHQGPRDLALLSLRRHPRSSNLIWCAKLSLKVFCQVFLSS